MHGELTLNLIHPVVDEHISERDSFMFDKIYISRFYIIQSQNKTNGAYPDFCSIDTSYNEVERV